MKERTLTITPQPDWRTALRQTVRRAQAATYQGEVLNLESRSAFFARLTERRWALVYALQHLDRTFDALTSATVCLVM